MRDISFLILSVTLFAACAETAVAESVEIRFSVDGRIGEVLVKYQEDERVSAYVANGTLLFFKPPFERPFQSHKTFVAKERPQLESWDVNGDGYKDVLFYNVQGHSANPAADVFLFVPKLGTFVQSMTLSGMQELQPAKRKGCVLTQYKSGPMGYTTEEWCFNIKTGRWRMVRSEGGEPAPE